MSIEKEQTCDLVMRVYQLISNPWSFRPRPLSKPVVGGSSLTGCPVLAQIALAFKRRSLT